GEELDRAGGLGDDALDLAATGAHLHVELVGAEDVGLAELAAGDGQGLRADDGVAFTGYVGEDHLVALRLEGEVDVGGVDGGLGGVRGGDKAGAGVARDLLDFAVVIEVDEEVVGGVIELALGVGVAAVGLAGLNGVDGLAA